MTLASAAEKAQVRCVFTSLRRSTKEMKSVVAACVLVCLALGASAQAPGQWISGTASHTNGPEGNNLKLGFPSSLPDASCGYGSLTAAEFPGFKLAGVAPNSILKDKSMGGCGTCLEVKCTDKTYCANSPTETVMVYDTCKDCTTNQLNLNAQVFDKLAFLELGNMPIMYRQVPCPFAGNIVVRVNNYRATAGGWLRLALRNVAGNADISSVEVARAGTANWIPMKNSFGANWELSKLPAAPLDLRVTTKSGQKAVLSGVITEAVAGKEGVNIPTTAQFKA
ncbi:hypothetical protein OEZ86_012795 [Tetradesmus obliquus]|nr:hypothetical protein OEZ86_012795 [Tetradesmus obliquus]